MTKIAQFEILTINGYVNRINKAAKCDFIKVEYKKLASVINAAFTIEGKLIAFEFEETAIAFLDGVFFWASSTIN